ncbi:hypothetical protein KHP62_03410 [Rhodobacteraceae bacterium NNCM2]|nr:hypothetical protein [Coraliihabitans acroporae]
MQIRDLVSLAILAALPTALSGQAQAAPVVVLSSSIDSLGPGSVVDSATQIELPAGAVLVINDATGKTRTLTGPFSGAIGETAKAGGESGLMTDLARLVETRETEQARLGAIRAAPGQVLRDPGLISISQSSTQCIAGETVTLWRPATMTADSTLSITEIGSGATAELFWDATSPTMVWPDALAPQDGGRYRFDLSIAPRPIELELHIAPTEFASPAQQAAWMSSKGCRRQAALVLDDLIAGEAGL